MKAEKEMAERHLINESHVYVGEGEIPSPTHHTRMCAHTRLCTGSVNGSQIICVLGEAWEKWGRAVGNMYCSLGRSNLACKEGTSQSEFWPICPSSVLCQVSRRRGNEDRVLNLWISHTCSAVLPPTNSQGVGS